MTRLTTRTVTMTKKQCAFVYQLVDDYANNSEKEALLMRREGEIVAATMMEDDAQFAQSILTSIRSAGA